jgi:hypothetical protein
MSELTQTVHPTNTKKKLIFCILFSLVASLSYVICDLLKLPLFTYYPAVNEMTLGFAKLTQTQGPAMYWYGWICSAVIAATVVAGFGASLQLGSKTSRYLAHLLWITLWILLPIIFNSLNFYWTHA